MPITIRGLIKSIAFLLIALLLITAWHRSDLSTPTPTPWLVDREGHFLGQWSTHNPDGYGYWTLESLPERVVLATLALEDRRFYQHPGVDPLAILRATWQNLHSGRRISGASTLAMQIARMQHPGPRHLIRKGVEALTAIFLTLRHGRTALLHHYLRLVPYGHQSHGIAHAARFYFDKPVQDLSWAEIALLTAIPQAPARMNPFTESGRERLVRRGQRLLDHLHHQGVLPEGEYRTARRQLTEMPLASRPARPLEALHALFSWLASSPPGGVITTTLDRPLQTMVQQRLHRRLESWREWGAEQAAAVVLRLPTREILAWVGSGGYLDPSHGAIDYLLTPRPSGSTLKPFLYGLGLERGIIQTNSILPDIPGLPYGIGNADGRYLGPLLPRQALANSRNVPAADLLQRLGSETFLDHLRRLGLDYAHRPAHHYGLTMAIGGLPVTLADLATAYAVLADDGHWAPLRRLRDGPVTAPESLFSPATARIITSMLADPQARLPSFQRLGALEYPFPVAVKTGTSQGYRDAWTVAYSRDYLVAVWVGRADALPMKQAGGADSAAWLARDILLHLHPDEAAGHEDLAPPAPANHRLVTICAHSGLQDAGRCPQTIHEWFPPDRIPESDDTVWDLTVDQRNGFLATPATPDPFRQTRRFYRLPALYSEWSHQRGMTPPPETFSPLDAPARLARPTFPDAREVRLSVVMPRPERRIFRLPTAPEAFNTILLRATVEPTQPQAVWYVDGHPYRIVSPPYTVPWVLVPGRHRVQLRLPLRPESSAVVPFTVE